MCAVHIPVMDKLLFLTLSKEAKLDILRTSTDIIKDLLIPEITTEQISNCFHVLSCHVSLQLLHENATLKGAVDVSRFHALTVLEVKRVPVHFLVGLGSLRSQLRVLICSRCVHSLQVLSLMIVYLLYIN